MDATRPPVRGAVVTYHGRDVRAAGMVNQWVVRSVEGMWLTLTNICNPNRSLTYVDRAQVHDTGRTSLLPRWERNHRGSYDVVWGA